VCVTVCDVSIVTCVTVCGCNFFTHTSIVLSVRVSQKNKYLDLNNNINLIKYFHCLDERLFTSTYKNQISALVIDINTNIVQDSTTDINNNLLFAHICTTFVNLRSLIFCPSSIGYQYLSFDILPPTIISSTLLELHLCLIKFCDCLYLLDGHFNQLRIFHVKIAFIDLRSLIFNKKVDYFNLT